MRMGSSHSGGVSGMNTLETQIGRNFQSRRSFQSGDLPATFQQSDCSADVANGWASAWSFSADHARLQSIANGNYDTRIINWVKSVPQGHKVDFSWSHEVDHKVAIGNATVAEINNSFSQVGSVFDQMRSNGVQQVVSNNVRLAICITNSNFLNNPPSTQNRFNTAISACDVLTWDIYGGAAGETRNFPNWSSDFFAWWAGTGYALPKQGRYGIWETSASDEKGSIELKSAWIRDSITLSYNHNCESYHAFHSSVNGSQPYFNRQVYMDIWVELYDLYADGSGGTTNKAPTARFTYTTDVLDAAFNGSTSTDPDGTIASYAWNFGDGTNGTGATPNHTYAAAGTYTVRLTVTDNDGASNSTSKAVSVNVTPPPPPSSGGARSTYQFVLGR